MWQRRMTGLLLALSLTALAGWSATAEQPARTRSALETDPAGWVDLMPGKDLQGWKRVVLPPDEKLNSKNPWKLSDDGKRLLCDGVGVKEMFLHEREWTDGIFHVEWRFQKVEGKTGYNSGIYVRTAADGKTWHQAQVAHQPDPPRLADLFGDTLVDGQVKRIQVVGKGEQLGKTPGDWNTYEITCKGKQISVWVNGAVATQWDACAIPKGHVGVQAEFWQIEFQNLKFKEIK